jgi:acetyltransferase-like isoleucine patch superfamily enzyme
MPDVIARMEREVRELLEQPMKAVALRSRIMHPYWRRRFDSFGARSILHKPTWLHGLHHAAVGDDTLILEGATITVDPLGWKHPAPVLRIGDRVGIRPYCVVSAAESIVIEDDVILGSFTTVIDSDHTFSLGRPNVMHNPLATAPVRIGRGTWLAERVAVLRGADVGRCCIIGANSVVRGEIPDYSIAVGSPARVVGTVSGVDADAAAVTTSLWG